MFGIRTEFETTESAAQSHVKRRDRTVLWGTVNYTQYGIEVQYGRLDSPYMDSPAKTTGVVQMCVNVPNGGDCYRDPLLDGADIIARYIQYSTLLTSGEVLNGKWDAGDGKYWHDARVEIVPARAKLGTHELVLSAQIREVR